MKETTSRRLFLQKTAIATTGVALLSSHIAHAFSTDAPFNGYNPYAEEKSDLRISVIGKEIEVKGILYDKDTFLPLANAMMEVWHLSPNSSKFRNRGKFKTGADGSYAFVSDFPNKGNAEASRVYFKVSHLDKTVFTELVLNESGAHISGKHWEENQHLGKYLFPKTKQFSGNTKVEFNLSI